MVVGDRYSFKLQGFTSSLGSSEIGDSALKPGERLEDFCVSAIFYLKLTIPNFLDLQQNFEKVF